MRALQPRTRKIRPDSLSGPLPELRIHARRGKALAENLPRYHCMSGERGRELQVLLTPGRVFRDGQIVNLQTPTPDEPRVLARYQNQPLAPAVWKHRRSLIDSVGVIAKLA